MMKRDTIPSTAHNFKQKMVTNWETVQKKTFTKWVNDQLQVEDYPLIADLYTDLSDGIVLIQLLEIISEELLGKFTLNPKHRLQKIENVNMCLNFLKQKSIQLTNIGAEDIVDRNPKLILGLIWSIIVHFTISEIHEEGLGAKEGLLLWCQRKTSGYKNVNIKDFNHSWRNGLGFCALIHYHYPELLDYDSLSEHESHKNAELAFHIAENFLNIPRLLDIEDVCDSAKPDDRSIMTYIAQYFHAFSEKDRVCTAGRRIVKFVEFVQSVTESKNDYERRAKNFLNDVNNQMNSWNDVVNNLSLDYKGYINEKRKFDIGYKTKTKSKLMDDKLKVINLFHNIQVKLKTYNLPPFVPATPLPHLVETWNQLLNLELSYIPHLNQRIKEFKIQLEIKFNQLADSLKSKLDDIEACMHHVADNLQNEVEEMEKTLFSLNQLKVTEFSKLNEFFVVVLDSTQKQDFEVIVSEVQLHMEILHENLSSKLQFLQNQLVSRSASGLSSAQLEEFESSFRYFDSENKNSLYPNQFKACLAGLGSLFPDDEFEKLFYHCSNGNKVITFDQFIKFMVHITEDQSNRIQLREAFNIVSENKVSFF